MGGFMNYTNYIKLTLLAFIFIGNLASAWANNRIELASKSPAKDCLHIDGDGAYQGAGASPHAARSDASIKCVNAKVDAFEGRYGALPDAETYDLMMDACINICK